MKDFDAFFSEIIKEDATTIVYEANELTGVLRENYGGTLMTEQTLHGVAVALSLLRRYHEWQEA